MRPEFSAIDFSRLGAPSRSLDFRWGGLRFLAHDILKIEDAKKARDPDWQRPIVEVGGNPHEEQIYNYFIWYACSFFAFVHLLDKAAKIDRFRLHPPFRGIKEWRHKIAAHTSFAKPEGDNLSTQLASLQVMPTWKGETGTYEEGGWIHVAPGEKPSNSKWRWSLTLVHRELHTYVTSVMNTLPADFTPTTNASINPIAPYHPGSSSSSPASG